MFVPLVGSDAEGQLVFTATNIPQGQMWPVTGFLKLAMSEIQRMRDGKNGYGP